MIDRSRVIQGLECCINYHRDEPDCTRCPYAEDARACTRLHELHGDAIALLKAQEPLKPHERPFVWLCGRCGFGVVAVKEEEKPGGTIAFGTRLNFCSNCGCEVKWDD